jgi:hypothetical protein
VVVLYIAEDNLQPQLFTAGMRLPPNEYLFFHGGPVNIEAIEPLFQVPLLTIVDRDNNRYVVRPDPSFARNFFLDYLI